ncbi:MAG TPA: ISL3 family transposase, partial [Bryobacteraceae bacterium]|nr:ISL3 family transposase [Bryobacteraceae bacterium]
MRLSARYTGPIACPHCQGTRRRNKGRRIRYLRHESWGTRHCVVALETHKWLCRGCGRSFWQRFPGILPRKRATEPFRRSVFLKHWDGISRSRLGEREAIGSATVERWFEDFLRKLATERSAAACPQVLGVDEHFFSLRHGYATTFCDLRKHRVFDVVLGRSEASLERYLERLEGKSAVRVVCMDLAAGYRALVRKHFPNARIVADRFHVIRLINHHFLACWRELDPRGSKHRGLRSLMRRHRHKLSPEQQARLAAYLAPHPVLELIYRFKQRLCYLLLRKHRTRKQFQKLIPRFLRAVYQLRQAGLAQLVQLGETLSSWSEEIVAMWRFTRNNGITEGFHTKMEVLQRQAYGFRNFNNYRLRVK